MALACAALVLASCAQLAGEKPQPVATAPVAPSAPWVGRTTADDVIAYLAQLRGMSDTALANEAKRQRAAIRGEREGDLARIRAALALTLSSATDEAEILGLVDPVAKREKADAGLRVVASFLHELAIDRRRLKESAAAANARWRDERRSQEQLRSAATAAQERATQLQQKLDALTALEKSLSDRPETTR